MSECLTDIDILQTFFTALKFLFVAMIEQCMSLAKEDKKTDILRLLSGHREALLNTVHAGQKQMDCLDFLTYTLKKELKSGGQLK